MNPTFTLKSVTFASAFATDAEAAVALRALPNLGSFGRSLLAQRTLSPVQTAWLHKLATDAVAPLNLRPIVALLEKAAAAQKKFPRITLQTAAGGKVVLALAGPKSRYPGAVRVTDGRPYGSSTLFCMIATDGTVKSTGEFDRVKAQLVSLAANPAAVAGQHGVATGVCCFCGLELSTKESCAVGYGPVCAEKFGLPWGDSQLPAEEPKPFAQLVAELTDEHREVFAKIAENRKAADAERKAAFPRNDDPMITEQEEDPCARSARETFETSYGRYTGARHSGD